MIQFFISYSRDCDFWDDNGDYRHPSREFWNWAEIVMGEGLTISNKPTADRPWAIIPHTEQIKNLEAECGFKYENGRLISFIDPELAMMFKLRWI